MIDVDSEDEVNTQKKKVTREASKKTPKKTKKKVTKKITQKKGVQKKKDLTIKGNVKNTRQARKNVKVNYETGGLFGVARGNISFLKPPELLIENPTGEEFQQHFPDPVPQTTASPPQIKKPSTSPKNPFVKTCPSFTKKHFYGSIHINCRYTKIFSNQL